MNQLLTKFRAIRQPFVCPGQDPAVRTDAAPCRGRRCGAVSLPQLFRRAGDNYVLERQGDLWRLLAAITINKLRGQVKFHTAKKRGHSTRRERDGGS